MPVKRVYTIRVILHEDQLENRDLMSFIECMRYNGIIRVLKLRPTDHDRILEIRPPNLMNAEMTQSWAKAKAERMTTFGFNAVAAPSWDGRIDPDSDYT
jgi:hypothetical protein